MIGSVIDIEERRRVLQTLPEDWYVDMDGSYASLPSKVAIDLACAAAERALQLGLIVEDIDPDANGGICVDLRSEQYAEASLYFRNDGRASVVSIGQGGFSEVLTESSWPKIVARLSDRSTT